MGESSKDRPGLRRGTPAQGSEAPRPAERSWAVAAFWATVIVVVGVIISAIINPILGRAVHWDWMAGLAPASFALLIWALHRRWV